MGRGSGENNSKTGPNFGNRRGAVQSCPNCQAQKDPKDLFCPYCGEDFVKDNTPHVLEPYPPGSSDSQNTDILEEHPPGSQATYSKIGPYRA